MSKQTIPIFFTINEGYVPYLSVSIISLIENAGKNNFYKIHILNDGLSEESIKNLKSLERDNVEFVFVDMSDKIKDIKEKLNKKLTLTHFPIVTYFRMFLPSMFTEYDKGIYIDGDSVLNADIAELYNFDLGENYIGGAVDKSVFDNPIADYFENAVGISRNKYINSGVLLLNMKELRRLNFEEYFLYILNKYDFEAVDPDQAYINSILHGHILYLPDEWNEMPVKDKKGLDNPKLIHYNLFLKPWHYTGISQEDYFWNAAEKSLFYDELKQELENYSDEMKKQDDETLLEMFAQGERISKDPNNFKNIFNNKTEKRLGE